jgi:hypothetical protein
MTTSGSPDPHEPGISQGRGTMEAPLRAPDDATIGAPL